MDAIPILARLTADLEASRCRNALLLRSAWDAAHLHGQPELAQRIRALYDAVSDPWRGVLSSADLANRPKPPLEPPEASRYRAYDLDFVRTHFATSISRAVALAWQRNYRRALRACEPPRPGLTPASAEVATTAAVLGDFDVALAVLGRSEIGEGARAMILSALVVEQARAGDEAGAHRSYEALLEVDRSGWSRTHVCIGLTGREPWGGYPYADY